MARLTLNFVRPGDVLSYLYDTGAMGYDSCFVTVLKVGLKKVYVRFESGQERWKYLYFFDKKMSPEFVVGLRAEGVQVGDVEIDLSEREKTILRALLRHNALTNTGGEYYLIGGHGTIPIRYNMWTLPNMVAKGLLNNEHYYSLTELGRKEAEKCSECSHAR